MGTSNVRVFKNDGDDQVQKLTPPAYLGTNCRFGIDDFTFEQVFKLTANTGANQMLSLWGRLSIRQLGFGVDVSGLPGAHVLRAYLGTSTATASTVETINLNQWYRAKISCRGSDDRVDLWLDDGNGYVSKGTAFPAPSVITTTERFQLFASNLTNSENPQALFGPTKIWSGYYEDGVPNDANLLDTWDPRNYDGGATFTSDAGQAANVTDGSPTGTIVNDDVPNSFLGIPDAVIAASKLNLSIGLGFR